MWDRSRCFPGGRTQRRAARSGDGCNLTVKVPVGIGPTYKLVRENHVFPADRFSEGRGSLDRVAWRCSTLPKLQ